MYEDLLDKIQHFIDSEIGDTGRLLHIKESLTNGKTLYMSDQRYLNNLISKYMPPENISDNTDSEKHR